MPMIAEQQRARGWILIQSDSPLEVAQALYNELAEAGGDDFVVIRVDVVEYVYNIIVPVDAANRDVLYGVRDIIADRPGVREAIVIPVLQLIPYPPQDAQSFITAEEADLGREPFEKPGRQHWSPGRNAWG